MEDRSATDSAATPSDSSEPEITTSPIDPRFLPLSQPYPPLQITRNKRKHSGRRSKKGTEVIRALRTSNGKPMKFDSVCTTFTRKLISLMQKLLTNTLKTTGPLGFNPMMDIPRSQLWKQMLSLARENCDLFHTLISPENLPNSEQKIQRRSQVIPMSKYRCFTAAFAENFYSAEAVRRLFYLMVELIFGQPMDAPSELVGKLKAKCCNKKSHNDDCKAHWAEYKEFVQVTMLQRLSLTPYFPSPSPPPADIELPQSSIPGLRPPADLSSREHSSSNHPPASPASSSPTPVESDSDVDTESMIADR